MIRKLAYSFCALLALASPAEAQTFPGQYPANTVAGSINGGIPGPLTNPVILGLTINPIAATSNQGLLITQSGSGSQSGGGTFIPGVNSYGLNLINVTSDNIARPLTGIQKLGALTINHDYGGAALTGGRNTLDIYSRLTAASAANNPDHNYQTVNLEWYSNVNDGGTGGTPKGAGFSIGGATILDNGATNWAAITFMEADVEVLTGASVATKFAIQLDALSNDAVQGSVFDALIGLTNAPGAVGWKNGILFNAAGGQAPLASNGCLLCTTGASTITNGIEISSYSYSGLVIHTPGFAIGNTGGIQQSAGPAAVWSVDSTNNTASVANGANVALPLGSGFALIREANTSHMAMVLFTANTVQIVTQDSGGFYTIGSTPAAGHIGVNFNGTNYAIFNNVGSTETIEVFDVRLGAN